MRAFSSVDDLAGVIGKDLGFSDWLTVSQEAVQLFADATGDQQWIHTDPVRAATGPFGSTIAHGYFTLALIPRLVEQIYRIDGVKLVINYGLERLRFPAVVPVGSAIRARATIISVEDVPSGTRVTDRVTIEVENNDKPACIAETISIYLPA